MPYQFKETEKVKLKEFSAYSSRGLPIWAWLQIVSVNDTTAKVEVLNGDQPTGQTVNIPTSEIQVPLGFKEVYEVVVGSVDDAKKLMGWIKDRGGVNVFTSLDLSCAGRQTFTAGDTEGKPHWSMGFVEKVRDPKRFQFKLEVESIKKPENAKKDGWKYDKHTQTWFRHDPIAV